MDNTVEIEKLFNTMMQLGKLMSQRTQESQEESAATMLQFSALSYVNEAEGRTVTDLAQFLKLSKSSATQLVERLVSSAVLLRKTDDNDKRITRLELTQKGKDEMVVMRKKFIATMKDAFADIPKKDILELIRIHTDMIESLKTKKYEQI